MTNFWRGLAQEITQSDAVLDATEALAPKSLEAVDAPVDVAIYTHVYNVHGDYMDSIEGGEGLNASEIHFLPFTQPAEVLKLHLNALVGLLCSSSFASFWGSVGLAALFSNTAVAGFFTDPDSLEQDISNYLLSWGIDLSAAELNALNQLGLYDYLSLLDFYRGPREQVKVTEDLAAKIRACSAFYIGKKTMNRFNGVYRQYDDIPVERQEEYAGIMYVSDSGELLDEACTGCTYKSTVSPLGVRRYLTSGLLESGYYPNANPDKMYVASWHTHPPAAMASQAMKPSGRGAYEKGDINGGALTMNFILSSEGDFISDKTKLPKELLLSGVLKTYRISGGLGILISKKFLTIYRHTGPRVRYLGTNPLGNHRFLQYDYQDYDEVYNLTHPLAYAVYGKKNLKMYPKY